MRILILNPPFIKNFSRDSRSPEKTKGGCLYYPYYLAYATGVLEKEGFDVKFIDAVANDWNTKKTMDTVYEFNPNLTVINTSTPSFYNDMNIATLIHLTGSFVVAVGTHVTALPEEALSYSLDAVARGEYDYTLRDLAFTLKAGKSLENVKGLSWRKDDRIIHNPDRPLIENLDELPFVSKVYEKHLDIKRYSYPTVQHPEVTMLTSRGCAFHCQFCLYANTFWKGNHRFRSVLNTINELEYIENNLDVREVMFEDATFSASYTSNRVKELCKEKINRGVEIGWVCIDGSERILIKKDGYWKLLKLEEIFESFKEKPIIENNAEIINTDNIYVFGLNEKLNLIPTRVTHVIRKRFEGPIYELKLQTGRKIKLTGDHKIPVFDGNNIKKKSIKDLTKNDKIVIPRHIKSNNSLLTHINILDELLKLPDKDLEHIYVLGLNEQLKRQLPNNKRYLLFKNKNKNPPYGYQAVPLSLLRDKKFHITKKTLIHTIMLDVKPILRISSELMRLLGYYVAEGCLQDNKKLGSYGVVLTFGSHEKKLINDAKKCIKKVFGVPFSNKKAINGRQEIIFGGKILKIVFEKIFKVGKYADRKRVPWLVFNVSPKLQKEFLLAYLMGDGSPHKKGDLHTIDFATVSEELQYGILNLALSLGYNIRLYEHQEKRKNRKKLFRGSIDLIEKNPLRKTNKISNSLFFVKINEKKKINYTKKYVYDLTIDASPHFFVAGLGCLISNCNSRADVDLETLELMKKSGCRELCVGFESAEQAVLNGIPKGLTTKQSKKFVEDAKKVGITIHGCFILGLPGETKKTVDKTIEFALDLEMDTVQFYPLMVYPGTPAFEWAKRNGYLKTKNWRDWIKKDGTHNCVVDRPNLPADFLIEKCDEALSRFYFRTNKITSILWSSLKSWNEFKRYWMGFKSYMGYRWRI